MWPEVVPVPKTQTGRSHYSLDIDTQKDLAIFDDAQQISKARPKGSNCFQVI